MELIPYLGIYCLSAYAKSSEKDAPFVVEGLLREMQDKFETTGNRSTKPNSRSFNTCVSSIDRTMVLNQQC